MLVLLGTLFPVLIKCLAHRKTQFQLSEWNLDSIPFETEGLRYPDVQSLSSILGFYKLAFPWCIPDSERGLPASLPSPPLFQDSCAKTWFSSSSLPLGWRHRASADLSLSHGAHPASGCACNALSLRLCLDSWAICSKWGANHSLLFAMCWKSRSRSVSGPRSSSVAGESRRKPVLPVYHSTPPDWPFHWVCLLVINSVNFFFPFWYSNLSLLPYSFFNLFLYVLKVTRVHESKLRATEKNVSRRAKVLCGSQGV